MSLLLINKMTTKDGMRDKVVQILLESGKAFNDNNSCLLYIVSKDKNDANVIWVQDAWTDQQAHQEAMTTASMKEYIGQALPLLEGMPQQIEIEYVGGKASLLQRERK